MELLPTRLGVPSGQEPFRWYPVGRMDCFIAQKFSNFFTKLVTGLDDISGVGVLQAALKEVILGLGLLGAARECGLVALSLDSITVGDSEFPFVADEPFKWNFGALCSTPLPT